MSVSIPTPSLPFVPWHSYSGLPPNSLGNDGDCSIDPESGDCYQKLNGVWQQRSKYDDNLGFIPVKDALDI